MSGRDTIRWRRLSEAFETHRSAVDEGEPRLAAAEGKPLRDIAIETGGFEIDDRLAGALQWIEAKIDEGQINFRAAVAARLPAEDRPPRRIPERLAIAAAGVLHRIKRNVIHNRAVVAHGRADAIDRVHLM